MRVPISRRLLACASLLSPCKTVADVGTDHGYLPVWLLQNDLCERVIAADLREKPLRTARANAARFGTADRTVFVQSDGLHNIEPGSFDALVCAGMGGDCIAAILDAAPWLREAGTPLILQPQSSGNDLRRWLGENGFVIEREILVQDGRFLYAAMRAKYGGRHSEPVTDVTGVGIRSPHAGDADCHDRCAHRSRNDGNRETALTPGQQFVSPALIAEHDPLLPGYVERLIRSLRQTVAGISKGETEDDRRKLAYYSAALREIEALNLS